MAFAKAEQGEPTYAVRRRVAAVRQRMRHIPVIENVPCTIGQRIMLVEGFCIRTRLAVLISCSDFFFNGIISAVVGKVHWDRCMWSPSRARDPVFDTDGGGRGRLMGTAGMFSFYTNNHSESSA
jgi:hypothetical protein